MMSFIRRIGYMKSGSGLEEAIRHVYAEKTVPHMMSGKAYARAVKGYALADSALNNILIKEIISKSDAGAENNGEIILETDLCVIENACNNLTETVDIDTESADALTRITDIIQKKKEQL
jgi:hypothetical protein